MKEPGISDDDVEPQGKEREDEHSLADVVPDRPRTQSRGIECLVHQGNEECDQEQDPLYLPEMIHHPTGAVHTFSRVRAPKRPFGRKMRMRIKMLNTIALVQRVSMY